MVLTAPEGPEADLRPLPWVVDFVLLGGGVGGLAPASVLVPMAMLAGSNAGLVRSNPIDLVLVTEVLLPSAALGGLLGVPVAMVLLGATRAARAHPLLLLPAGFPVGAAAGGLVGEVLGTWGPFGYGAAEGIAVLGAVCGGLLLGFGWLPYLALKLRGRSGLPWIVAATGLAVIVGPVTMGSFLLVG